MSWLAITMWACLSASLHAGPWTVDDDGPADFGSIQAAIDALPAGETILVHSGTYEPFHLHKRMQIHGILGSERPRVARRSRVSGAASFTIAGLHLDALTVEGVPGRGSIEDCALGMPPDGLGLAATLDVKDCEQLIIARTTVFGLNDYPSPTQAMAIGNSNVTIVGCSITGGKGLPADIGSCGVNGAAGLGIGTGSRVVIVQSSIRGGEGGWANTFSTCDGNGGLGVFSTNAHVEFRSCTVLAGMPGLFFIGVPALPVHVSGGTLVSPPIFGTFVSGAQLVVPPYLMPTAALASPVAPDSPGELMLGGPDGQAGLLVLADATGLAALAHYEGLLWVVPNVVSVVAVTTPQVLSFTVPATPVLSGRQFTLQAVFPGLPGVLDPTAVMTGNPEQLIIRF